MARILVVDDREEVRVALSMLLEDRGHQVIEATDGTEVLPRALENAPDLILLDLAMPMMDGFGALKELHTDASTREIPVIVITARTDLGDQARAMAMGVADYIIKPFAVADVITRVDLAIRRARSSASAQRDKPYRPA